MISHYKNIHFFVFCIEKPVKPMENMCFYIFSIFSFITLGLKIQKHPKIQDFQRDTRLSFGLLDFGFLDFWIFGFLDFWIFGFLDFWIFGFLDFWISGCLDFRIFGFLDFGQYKLVLPI